MTDSTTASPDNPLDAMIARDLRALGDDSRTALLSIDDTLRATGVYRDDLPGAEARRDALVEQRRRELAFLPLRFAHVYAHRVGRAAAGATALVAALAVAYTLSDPLLLQLARYLVPGLDLTVIVLAGTAAILAAYVIGSWIAERHYERRMQSALATAGDAYKDLDQLAHPPLEVARSLLRSLDLWSVAFPVAGAVATLSLVGYVSFVLELAFPFSVVWSSSHVLGEHIVRDNLAQVMGVAVIAAAASFLVARGATRTTGAAARIARILGHWSMLPLSALIGFATLVETARLHFHLQGYAPSATTTQGLAIAGVLAVFILTTWTLLWWRRREHARLGEDD